LKGGNMKFFKSIIPLWIPSGTVVVGTSIGESLNVAEQILKIILILVTMYFTVRIGKKKLRDKKDNDLV